jgi:hypothetical protein
MHCVQFLHREDWNLVLSIQLFIVESLVQWFLVTPLNGMIAVNGLHLKKKHGGKTFGKGIFLNLHFIIIINIIALLLLHVISFINMIFLYNFFLFCIVC